MSQKPTDDGDPHEVGYCSPPRKSQWKKGQSGNPRGRPRKSDLKPLLLGLDPATRSLLEQDERRLKVRTPDGEVEMRRSDAVWEKIVKLALSGDRKAAEYYVNSITAAWQKSEQHKAELQRFVVTYVTEYGPQFEFAEEQGRAPPNVLPHPRDIIVDENYDVIVVGPVNHWQQLEMERHLADRDLCDEILNTLHRNPGFSEEEYRLVIEKIRTGREKLNEALPPRLQKASPDETH